MATYCSILAWRISWTEETGGFCPWGGRESDTAEQLSSHRYIGVQSGLDGKCIFDFLRHLCSVVSDSLPPPRTAAHQASLSYTISWSFLILMSLELS